MHKTTSLQNLIVLFFAILISSCNVRDKLQQEEHIVTLRSLLKEMVSRESIAMLPITPYKNLQASSYDRNTLGYSQGWHANGDRSYFLKTEKNNNGRYEHVMLKTKGPGAIVRFWNVTSKVELLEGTIRFYIDSNDKPQFSGTLKKLIGGNFFADYPLSMELAEESELVKRGRNLYLPIPFEKSIKITYEKPDGKKLIEGVAAWPNDAFFYNINYRLYDSLVKVESISTKSLQESKELIESSQMKLVSTNVSRNSSETVTSFNGKIPSNKQKIVYLNAFPEGGAINTILLKLSAENLPQALRSTILEITFDGERTVWTPVGDFFGTGYQIRQTKNWYTTVGKNGLMTSRWIMPFEKNCTIKLHNLGLQDVNIVLGEASVIDWKWNDRSMHFGSAWQQYTKINSKPDRDLNYVTLEGKGIYVGDVLTLFDSSPQWWGEGDEKIFVDDDSFPKHFGTGSEDYYGYAWCLGAKFSSPFVSQPDGSGNENIGYTVNSRFRLLDAIPFRKKLRFDMELQHWKESRLNYSPTVFWYARPGVKVNIPPMPEEAKLPVALSAEDF